MADMQKPHEHRIPATGPRRLQPPAEFPLRVINGDKRIMESRPKVRDIDCTSGLCISHLADYKWPAAGRERRR